MQPTFLTYDELAELTGYQRKRYQILWLREHEYPYELDKDGRPKVLRATMLARMGAEDYPDQPPRLHLE